MEIAPRAIADDWVTYATNTDGMAGLLVPLVLRGKKLKGQLLIACDDMETVQKVIRLIQTQPVATPKSYSSIEVKLFASLEDELASLQDKYALDAVLTCLAWIRAGDMKIRWNVEEH